jgi:two-component system phosphate regulon response regulator PhoB
MTASKILIVEDEVPIREMIVFHLVRAGFETLEAGDCRSARQLLVDERPDVALIDWMLPDMSGLELTRTLKREKGNEDLGIIMLTARADEYDKVAGLEGGADDYITKPFAPRELIARIQAVLRRAKSINDELIQAGVLELDSAGHRVTGDGHEIRLGPTEYRLLQFLMTHPYRVYSRTQLLDRVKALMEAGADAYIQTVRGAGYRFSARSQQRDAG